MTNLIILSATILLFFCVSSLNTTADNMAVLDTDGHPLQAGTNYYILPIPVRGRGGGLTLDSKNATELCPLYVAHDTVEVSNGLPLKLYPGNPEEKIIPLYSDLNFVFDVYTICVQSTVWRLTRDDEIQRWYVGLGGEIGNPDAQTISNWFKIDKAGSGENQYKIVYCPSVCQFCRPVCGEVGVFVEEDGRRLLGLFSDQPPLVVMFKKALEEGNGSSNV